jgi:hypothetical protein
MLVYIPSTKNFFINPIITEVTMKTQKKIAQYALFVLMVFAFSSCIDLDGDYDQVTGKGAVISQERDLGSFNHVFSAIGADINIYQSDESKVVITMQENLFSYLETNVKESILGLSFGTTMVRATEPITIDIYTPTFKKFSLSGAGDVYSEMPAEEILISGAGRLEFKGQGTKVAINVSGAADINLYEMPVDEAQVRVSGSGNVWLQAEEKLDITISGSAKIYYKGQPVISTNITGLGEVVNQN